MAFRKFFCIVEASRHPAPFCLVPFGMIIPNSPAGFDIRNAVDLASRFLGNLSLRSENTFAELDVGRGIPLDRRMSRARVYLAAFGGEDEGEHKPPIRVIRGDLVLVQ